MPDVYRLYHIASGKSYIGMSKNVPKRIEKRFYRMRKGRVGNTELKRDFDKFGRKAFAYEVLEKNAPPEREKYWIQVYDSFHNGYNATFDGKVPKAKPVVWEGIRYSSIYECSKQTGLTVKQLRARLKKGYTCEADMKGTAKSIFSIAFSLEINGKRYETISEACADLGITRSAILSHIK